MSQETETDYDAFLAADNDEIDPPKVGQTITGGSLSRHLYETANTTRTKTILTSFLQVRSSRWTTMELCSRLGAR